MLSRRDGGGPWLLPSSSSIMKSWRSARTRIREPSTECFAILLSSIILTIGRPAIVSASTLSWKRIIRSRIRSNEPNTTLRISANRKRARNSLRRLVTAGVECGIDTQNRLLSLHCVKCRQNVREPGIGEVELERLSDCPADHLEFHLWHLKEIKRLDPKNRRRHVCDHGRRRGSREFRTSSKDDQ
jgi:hypothetical protein